MLNCLIVEDELNAAEVLKMLLQRSAAASIKIIGVERSVADAISRIDECKPSLVFMDVNILDGTAFDVLEKIKHKDFYLVFTTAFDQYAIKAFQYSALDYLLKPIDTSSLVELLNKINNLELRYANLIQINHAGHHLEMIPQSILISTQEGIHIIQNEEIIRCKTSGSYTTFYKADGKNILASKSLTSFENILQAPKFLRVHNSHLINTSKVKLYDRKGFVIMIDGSKVEVSRNKKVLLMEVLSNLKRM